MCLCMVSCGVGVSSIHWSVGLLRDGRHKVIDPAPFQAAVDHQSSSSSRACRVGEPAFQPAAARPHTTANSISGQLSNYNHTNQQRVLQQAETRNNTVPPRATTAHPPHIHLSNIATPLQYVDSDGAAASDCLSHFASPCRCRATRCMSTVDSLTRLPFTARIGS